MSDECPRTISISMFNLCVLLHNLLEANKDKRVGSMEVDLTFDQLVRELNKRVHMPGKVLESAYYYSNMMSELDMFWHPNSICFDTFIKRSLPQQIEFDKYYNALYYKNKENGENNDK